MTELLSVSGEEGFRLKANTDASSLSSLPAQEITQNGSAQQLFAYQETAADPPSARRLFTHRVGRIVYDVRYKNAGNYPAHLDEKSYAPGDGSLNGDERIDLLDPPPLQPLKLS